MVTKAALLNYYKYSKMFFLFYVIYSCDAKLTFQQSLLFTWSFRNNCYMLICSSGNIYVIYTYICVNVFCFFLGFFDL